jgi:hypothetical protein
MAEIIGRCGRWRNLGNLDSFRATNDSFRPTDDNFHP